MARIDREPFERNLAPLAEARLQQPGPCFLGHSAGARRVLAQIHRAVRSRLPVLIVGATGTGRETIARTIHHYGGGEVPRMDIVRPRRRRPLVGLGGFTYLADLEDLALDEQARLAALAGAGRLVVATQINPDSREAAERLNPQVLRWVSGIRIDVPPLAARGEDLELLAMDVLRRMPLPRAVGGLSDDALECLRRHPWPGQLDEFSRVLAEAVARGCSELVELDDLPARVRSQGELEEDAGEGMELDGLERDAIRRALLHARGNKRKAAKLLGIGKTTLYRKLRVYGLSALARGGGPDDEPGTAA